MHVRRFTRLTDAFSKKFSTTRTWWRLRGLVRLAAAAQDVEAEASDGSRFDGSRVGHGEIVDLIEQASFAPATQSE